MSQDLMRYDLLAQDALRAVVRKSLQRAARQGLPGDHHFYIAFATRAPGVQVSQRLAETYPEEMTIVLQHQFIGLEVGPKKFSVQLSFNNIPETLVVPFAAVKGFYDPSVQFGLQFDVESNQNDRPMAGIGAGTGPEAANTDEEDPGSADDAAAMEAVETVAAAVGAVPGEGDASNDSGADVVSLDQFRKKP